MYTTTMMARKYIVYTCREKYNFYTLFPRTTHGLGPL